MDEMTFHDWSGNDSNKCTEISKLAETVILLNNQLQIERQRCDELKEENLALKNKIFHQKFVSKLVEPCEKTNIVNVTQESKVNNAVGKIQASGTFV